MEKRPRVLSIDDNAVNQKLVERVLAADYEVETAMSGTSGIEVLRTFMPDAILLDVDMPDLDGFHLCRMIRSEPVFAHTPILFVSCLDGREHQLKGYQAGADDYILKPFNVSNLKQRLTLSLDRVKGKASVAQACNDAPALEQNLQYLHDCLLALIDLSSMQALGDLLLHTLGKLGLQGAIYVHATGQTHSSIGPLTDLETLLLQQARQTYPTEYSARFLWGSLNVGVLVQNMPQAKNALFQPLKQILLTLSNAANRKIDSLQRAPTSSRRAGTGSISSARDIQAINIQGYKLESALEDLEQQSESQLDEVCSALQDLASDPGRNVYEKEQLKQLAQKGIQARIHIYDRCLEVQTHYRQIMQVIGQGE